VSDLVTSDSAKIVIGVCGEQGAGKTVFLTCIFQSLAMHLPNDVIFDFDRKEIGNATYFQSVEEQLVRDGVAPGNQRNANYPVRIVFRPADEVAGESRRLSLDLIDFAGGHFRSLSDLRSLSSSDDSAETLALREVNRFMESAHAFIILINSREIDPGSETPDRHPFSPSVNFLLGHCQSRKKPVALLFSQIDQSRFVKDRFASLPRVRAFRERFSDEMKEGLRGNRPFGMARTISCYETVPGDLRPLRQSDDGNIWRPEPAQAVLELLKVVRPQVERDIAEQKRLAEERENAIREAEDRRRNFKFFSWISAFVLTGGLLATAAHCAIDHRTKGQTDLVAGVAARVQAGSLAALPGEVDLKLSPLLASYRAAPNKTPQRLGAALRKLQAEHVAAVNRAVESPKLDSRYTTEISALVAFAGRLPESPPLKAPLATLFDRGKFLGPWFSRTKPERRDRTASLDQASRKFQRAGDRRFALLLAETSLREKAQEVGAWSERLAKETGLEKHLALLQSLLASALREGDTDLAQLARKATADHLAAALLQKQENPWFREEVLKPFASGLAEIEDSEIRFEIVAREVLACQTEESCREVTGSVEAASEEAQRRAEGRSSLVENLLQRLFRDLPANQQRELWTDVAAALDRRSLFGSSAQAAGVTSLASSIRDAVSTRPIPTAPLIERLARGPVYQAELSFLNDQLTRLAALRQLIPVYSEMLTRTADRRTIFGLGQLASLRGQLSAAVKERANGALQPIRDHLEEVIRLADAANSTRLEGADAMAPARLRQKLEELRRDYCTQLSLHAPPAECRDAA
jgi:hypothetical protein